MSRQHSIDNLVPYDDLKINIKTAKQNSSMTVASSIMSEHAGNDKLITTSTSTNHNFSVYIMAGAAAGIMEHCVMYPVDSVKTRLQSLRPHPKAVYSGIRDAFMKISRTEGMLRPLRGINIVALGAGPSHALYFCSYEVSKKLLNDGSNSSHIGNAAAGAVATVFHDGTMNPFEVIKQRLQVYNSPYRGVYDCTRSILQNEGISAFYRSFTTQVTMNIPFQCIHFVTYEIMRGLTNPDDGYNLKSHLLSGATAGGVAAAITTPLDVAKTLLNTQEHSVLLETSVRNSTTSNRIVVAGMFNALRTIHRLSGVNGYFRGVSARVLYQMPSCAISWSVYEFFKHNLSLSISDEDMIDLTA